MRASTFALPSRTLIVPLAALLLALVVTPATAHRTHTYEATFGANNLGNPTFSSLADLQTSPTAQVLSGNHGFKINFQPLTLTFNDRGSFRESRDTFKNNFNWNFFEGTHDGTLYFSAVGNRYTILFYFTIGNDSFRLFTDGTYTISSDGKILTDTTPKNFAKIGLITPGSGPTAFRTVWSVDLVERLQFGLTIVDTSP